MTRATRATRVLIAALAVTACSADDVADPPDDADSPPPSPPAPATDDQSSEDTTDSVQEVPRNEPGNADVAAPSLSIEPSPLIGLVADLRIDTSAPTRVEVTARSGDHVVEVPRTARLSNEHSVPVVGMWPDRTYQITVVAFDDADRPAGDPFVAEFTTASLPEWFPEQELTIDAARSSPGYTIVESGVPSSLIDAPEQVLIGYDNTGEVVWYYTNTGSIGGVEQTANGTFLSHYWPFGIRQTNVLGELVGHWRPQPTGSDSPETDDDALIDTLDPDSVERWGGALDGNPGDMPPVPVRADWVDLNGFHHENWPMPNGNVLALSATNHELTPAQRDALCPGDPEPFSVISDVIVEFAADGTVLRTWDLWDVVDVEALPGSSMCSSDGFFAGLLTRDWTHANSVVYDTERDALIVSSRHTNQIIAFDHLDSLGPQSDVRWIRSDPSAPNTVHRSERIESFYVGPDWIPRP